MVNVNIKFNGKDYLLSCDAGQEDNLKELGDFLDNKYLDLKNDMTFRVDLTYSQEYDEKAYILTNDLDKFSRTYFSNNLTLRPSLTYAFSAFVSGEVFVTHIVTESKGSGRNAETCFGFEVMILFESIDTNNNSNYQTSGGSYSPYF